VLLLIQKSAAENCDTVDSEIGSQAVSLPIQKLAIKNCVAANLEIDSDCGVISSFNLPFFFFGVYNVYDVKKRMKRDRY
jgi:hypothetical protein